MKKVTCKVAIAIVVEGKPVQPGTVIELEERDAKAGFRDGSLVPVTIADVEPPKFKSGKLDPANFDKATKAELIIVADDLGIEVPAGATKAQIIELICSVEVDIPVSE